MQRVFLSYTFQPHPDLAAETELLQRTVRRVIEAMNLTVVTGVDLGGHALEGEIDKRIEESDAFVALITPQADNAGNRVPPEYVNSEFQKARALGKSRLRVLHHDLIARGLGTAEEHQSFHPDKLLDVVMKLLQTLAIWKRELGRPVQIQIHPDHLATQFDPHRKDSCEYQLMLGGNELHDPKPTRLWPEPGAAYVYVPDFVDGARVRVRLLVNGDRWQSAFVLPQMGGVALTKMGG